MKSEGNFHTIENSTLKVTVNEIGAELCRIQSQATGMEYMWDANPEVWASYAPVLFPIVGELKEGTYLYQENNYQLPRHGIMRQNPKVKLSDKSEQSLSFMIEYDEDTLLVYPFKFRFTITFGLDGNRILVQHRVENLGEDKLYFSLGGHPAFRCPRYAFETYDDFYLEFEHRETVSRWLITDNGLLSGATEPVLADSAILPLKHSLFTHDALVFKDLRSRKVSLKSKKSSEVVTVSFPDFPYLGIWAKPAGDYVCIEPWLGVADSQSTDQKLEHKEAILLLPAQDTFSATYSIEITE
jgi:galactose mutarotase-like enzyme